MSEQETVHATCVALPHGERLRAVLIMGRSGAGKSDLALRLIDRGARLVSDDYTLVSRREAMLVASPPPRIAGQIEVRGIGIVAQPHVVECEVGLVLALDGAVDRLPDEPATITIAGAALRTIALSPFEASAPIKAELAVTRWWRSIR